MVVCSATSVESCLCLKVPREFPKIINHPWEILPSYSTEDSGHLYVGKAPDGYYFSLSGSSKTRGAGGTPLTYMLHGHIHKTTDQELVDRFCAETRAVLRKSAHQETAQPVPCQMINCFCMYSDYTPLTLEEWVECDQRRRGKADCG